MNQHYQKSHVLAHIMKYWYKFLSFISGFISLILLLLVGIAFLHLFVKACILHNICFETILSAI